MKIHRLRYAVPGALLWLVALWFREPDLTRTMLWFGVLVIAPLALQAAGPDRWLRLALRLALPAGAVLVLFELPHGLQAVPWAAVTLLLALRGAWLGLSRRPGRDTVRAAGFVFAGVAGMWTLADAAGRDFGYGPMIALLTAVHFHYAGLALQVLAWRASASASRAGLLAGFGVTVGTPLVGAAFVVAPLLELPATLLLAVSALVLSAVQSRQALAWGVFARVLMWVASASFVVGMALAVVYAAGMTFETYWISIPRMVQTHGLLNGFGFCLCALLARILAENQRLRSAIGAVKSASSRRSP
jgi:hypothetical protein